MPDFKTTFSEPYLEWIAARALRPWRLQRLLNSGRVKMIANEWNPNTFGHLIVSRHGTTDTLLDGQHRWVAVMREFNAPDQKLLCLVYENLTDAQETEIFHSQGPLQRRSVSGIHDAMVLFEGGNPDMVALYRLCQDAGVNLVWHNSKQDNTTVAIQTLKSTVRHHGPEHLTKVLTLLRDALGPDQHAYSGRMITGMSSFLLRYEDHEYFDRKQFCERMQTVSAEGVEREGNKIAAVIGIRNDATNIGRAMHAVYNLRKSHRRLPEWQVNVTSPLGDQRRRDALAKTVATRPSMKGVPKKPKQAITANTKKPQAAD